jgi:hypothetical protein
LTFLSRNNLISSTFDSSKVDDKTYIQNFIDALVNEEVVINTITSSVNEYLDSWSETYVNKFKNGDFELKTNIQKCLKIVVFLMEKIGMPFNDAFPTLDTCQVPNMKYYPPDPYYFDLVTVLGYLYGLSINNLNFINENQNMSLTQLFELVNGITNFELM